MSTSLGDLGRLISVFASCPAIVLFSIQPATGYPVTTTSRWQTGSAEPTLNLQEKHWPGSFPSLLAAV